MYNRRYYENGGDTMQPDSSGQGIMQAAPQGMQQQGMPQPPLADQAQGQDQQIKDPQHALQIIIQMLVAQGIPPEQAKQIAMEMIKAVAQGGMEEVTSDEKVHARFGGHITRQHYLFGGLGKIASSIIGGIGGAASGLVKGVANVVKSIAGSSLGKMALLAAAAYFGGPLLFGEVAPATTAAAATEQGLIGQGLGNATLAAAAPSAAIPAATSGIGAATAAGYPSAITSSLGYNSLLTPASASIGAPSLLQTASSVASDPSLSGITSLGKQALTSMIPSSITDAALKYGPSLLGGVIGGSLTGGMPQQQPGESNADFQKRVDEWNSKLSTNMSSPTFNQGAFPNNPFYSMYARKADGGRIGYETGGISNIIGQATREGFFGTPMLAHGGVPTGKPRQNQHGVNEIDYRNRGGYVPPIGVKEKADDIPAMLSNNEFVFTAKAVRNAGRGNVNKGAQRMYSLMKHLEAGGVV